MSASDLYDFLHHSLESRNKDDLIDLLEQNKELFEDEKINFIIRIYQKNEAITLLKMILDVFKIQQEDLSRDEKKYLLRFIKNKLKLFDKEN